MRRSFSNPSLSKKKYVPRNISVPVSLTDLVNDVFIEYQIECVTHSSGYIAGLCSHEHNFPMDLINREVDKETIEIVGSCLASPPDGECTKQNEDNDLRLVVRTRRRKNDT